ncbi:hypothetical protein Dsin_025113 [Dipteronia sinensis]|uniref:Reverse transcriptase domain-containing protein n=1 Tax=Dipteronia sinensis TaxID=43782 RepID=A0AAE0DWT5_9ROSI|nr:hypothetical protein Dsin_025113 [Dipteronia sinensis]
MSEFTAHPWINKASQVSSELLHSISRRKEGKKGLMASKLDLSKAHERVEWGFIRMAMEKMNFPTK